MSTTNQILVLPPVGEPPKPRKLDVTQMEVVGRFGPFHDGLPSEWTPEAGSWEVKNGCLHGRAAPDQAAFLTWGREIGGNHAIRYRGAALKHEGETNEDVRIGGNLNCIWDYVGTYPKEYKMSVAGFGGWYAGMSGIELLGSEIPVAVRSLTAQFALEADRVYDIMAGRFYNTKFLFADGRLAMGVEVDPKLLGKTAEHMRESFSRVALCTDGREGGSEVRIESIEVYRIPDEAVRAQVS